MNKSTSPTEVYFHLARKVKQGIRRAKTYYEIRIERQGKKDPSVVSSIYVKQNQRLALRHSKHRMRSQFSPERLALHGIHTFYDCYIKRFRQN